MHGDNNESTELKVGDMKKYLTERDTNVKIDPRTSLRKMEGENAVKKV